MTNFWTSDGGAIIFFVAIACICMPIAYMGLSLQSNADQCIGCESEALELGHNIENFVGVVIVSDLIAFLVYLVILYNIKRTKRRMVEEMTVSKTETGSLCPNCHKFGMQIIGREPAGKNTFRNVKMCRFCGHRVVK